MIQEIFTKNIKELYILSYLDFSFKPPHRQPFKITWELVAERFTVPLCSVPWTYVLPTAIPIYAVALVQLSKLFLQQNRIRKVELVQTVTITKYRVILRKAIMSCACEPLRRAYTWSSFTRLTRFVQGYTTYLVPSK